MREGYGEWYVELTSALGEEAVDVSESGRAWAAEDAAGAYRLGGVPAAALPLAVVRPRTVEAVAWLLRWASGRGIPVVPRGAGTGVMGAVRTDARTLVLDLVAFRDVAVYPEDMVVEAGAGAVLADVNARLAPYGLMLGHDPWSVGLATVGGALSTDGVGYLAGRWGSMGDQVLGVEAVLADGRILRTRPVRPLTGPRLASLFVGSQGALGVVVRAWLRAVPVPEVQRFRSFRFRGFGPGYQALLRLWRTGLTFDLLDMGDDEPGRMGLPPGWEDALGRTAVLHLGSFGPRAEAEARLEVARGILGAYGVDLGEEPARQYWERRHEVAEEYAREVHGPRDLSARARHGRAGMDYLNVCLPPRRVVAYREAALARVRAEPGYVAGEAGIWCRPELFSLVVYEGDPGDGRPREGTEAGRMGRLMSDLLHLALQHGGNAEGIHGSGAKLRAFLAPELGEGLAVLAQLKGALDPAGVLQPGLWPGNTEVREPGPGSYGRA